jgi:hypothetical protein
VNKPVERSFPAPALTCGEIYHIRQIKFTVKVGSMLVGFTILQGAENESRIKVIFVYGKPQQEETGTTTTTCSVWAKIMAWHTKLCCQGHNT